MGDKETEIPVTIKVNYDGLDEALEKMEKLVSLKKEADELADTLDQIKKDLQVIGSNPQILKGEDVAAMIRDRSVTHSQIN